MAEVGRKSWNRGCIPIVVFGRDKARISISHSPRSSLIPRILTAADLSSSPRRQLLFHSNRSRPSPYLSRNRSNDIRQIRLEIKRLRTSSFLYRLASVVESDRSFLLKKKKERKEGNVKLTILDEWIMFHDFLVTNKKVWEDGFVITSKRIRPIVRTVGRITDRKWPRPWHVSNTTRPYLQGQWRRKNPIGCTVWWRYYRWQLVVVHASMI